jgi:threo-3-hydroxy-L-aspartate ammonia-lyase
MAELPPLVTLASIEAAAAALPDQFRNSPVIPWPGGAWLKLESIQPTGSFKIRGAWTKLDRLSADGRARGVVAYSSGNHGIAVAHAARLRGVRATIVVSEDAPGPKTGAIAAEGGALVPCGGGSEGRRLRAEDIAARTGQALVPPYNDADVIAGQGTIGLELLRQLPGLTSVVVPVGGGGLISGIAAAVKAVRPSVRVIGVEPELAGDARETLSTGSLVQWPAEEVGQTIADGIRTQSLGPLNFAHVVSLVDEIVTVSDEDILEAAVELMRSRHLIVEPSGAVSVAAVRNGTVPADGAAIVVSGGNASAEILTQMVRRAHELEEPALARAEHDIRGFPAITVDLRATEGHRNDTRKIQKMAARGRALGGHRARGRVQRDRQQRLVGRQQRRRRFRGQGHRHLRAAAGLPSQLHIAGRARGL